MSRGRTRGPWTPFYLPAGPLVERVHGRGGVRAVTRSERLERAFYRAQRARRLTVWAADLLAVRLLGEHPMVVWGDEWLYGPQEPVLRPLDELAQRRGSKSSSVPSGTDEPRRTTNCRPGCGPCRRRHEHASSRRAS